MATSSVGALIGEYAQTGVYSKKMAELALSGCKFLIEADVAIQAIERCCQEKGGNARKLLILLLARDYNVEWNILREQLITSKAADSLFAFVASAVSSTDVDDAIFAFWLMRTLMEVPDHRYIIADTQISLFPALFAYIRGNFASLSLVGQLETFRFARNLLLDEQLHFDNVAVGIDAFLKSDGFHTVMTMFWHVYSSLFVFDPQNQGVHKELLQLALTTLSAASQAARMAKHANVPLESCSLDRNNSFRLTAALYKLLTEPSLQSPTNCRLVAALLFVWVETLCVSGDFVAVEGLLLHKPARSEAGSELVLQLLNRVVAHNDGGGAVLEFSALVRLRVIKEKVSAKVGALVDEFYAKNARAKEEGDGDEKCAFPDCQFDPTGLISRLKVCARCKSVHYCDLAHQQAHWPVHSTTCVQAPLTPEEAEAMKSLQAMKESAVMCGVCVDPGEAAAGVVGEREDPDQEERGDDDDEGAGEGAGKGQGKVGKKRAGNRGRARKKVKKQIQQQVAEVQVQVQVETQELTQELTHEHTEEQEQEKVLESIHLDVQGATDGGDVQSTTPAVHIAAIVEKEQEKEQGTQSSREKKLTEVGPEFVDCCVIG